MLPALPLAAALKRGALVTAANWPVVLVEFVVETLWNVVIAVPVVGGVFMVAVLVGGDVRQLLDGGVRAATDLVLGLLVNAPSALTSFLVAVALAFVGGSLVVAVVRIATIAVLTAGETQAPDTERAPIRLDWFRRASAYSTPTMIDAVRRFGRRALGLAVWTNLAYGAVAVAYLAIMRAALPLTDVPVWRAAWPLIVALSTSAGIVAVAGVNLVSDLLQIIIVVEDDGLLSSARRLRAFLLEDVRQVIGIFVAMGAIITASAVVGLLATAGLALVAWVPIIGLVVVPLQAAGWLVRGLVQQYLGFVTLAAYETQYGRFAAERRPPAPHLLVQRA